MSGHSAEYDAVLEAVKNAEHAAKCAEAVESAMRSIRLGYLPTTRQSRRFWFGVDERKFTRLETSILYEALQIVRRTHKEREAEFRREATRVTPPGVDQ